MKHSLKFVLAGCALAGFSATAAPVDWSKLPPASTQANVTFTNDIQPILKAACVRCHGANQPRAQLNLSTLEGVLKGTKVGPVLKAGDSANSLLVKAVSQLDPDTAMPPKPRGRRGPGGGPGRPPGTNAPDMQPRGEGGPGPDGQPPRNFGPPAKPLTTEQVGLIRAWIDQGAK